MSRLFILFGSLNCFLAVALGAFGAHGLKHVLSPHALQTWNTAVDYQFFHALGLLLIALLQKDYPRIKSAGWIMLAGIVIFSGSLYLLSLTGIRALGMITPIGGVCFLIAWLWLAIKARH